MDSLTQAAVGAVIGELILGKKIGWRGAAWGAFFGTLPDLDVIALPFLDAAQGIRWHRGISHSILVMILASFVLSKRLATFHKKQSILPREAGWMIFWAWSTHVLVDCFTTYGTQIFEPFSNYRVAMNTFFIVDPLFTLPLLVGLVKVFRVDVADFKRRRRIMKWAVGVSCLYFAFGCTMKQWAGKEIQSDLVGEIPYGKLVAVAPSSFNTILWRGLIETEAGYFLTYWSPFDRGKATYDYIPKNRKLANDFEGTDELEALKWFSRGHWVARKGDDGTTVIIDMRFTEIRDPENGTLQPIFQWHLSRDSAGHINAPMLRPKDLNYMAAISVTWQRIWGEKRKWDALKPF